MIFRFLELDGRRDDVSRGASRTPGVFGVMQPYGMAMARPGGSGPGVEPGATVDAAATSGCACGPRGPGPLAARPAWRCARACLPLRSRPCCRGRRSVQGGRGGTGDAAFHTARTAPSSTDLGSTFSVSDLQGWRARCARREVVQSAFAVQWWSSRRRCFPVHPHP